MTIRAHRRHRRSGILAGLLATSLLLSSCGGTKSGEEVEVDDDLLTAPESGLADAGDPVRGGTLNYALEADTNGGFCLPEGQLAISGMMVVRAVYDTLTVPNADGEFVPYLAKDITHDDDYQVWDIELREGIKFHDGTDLTAEVVKNNLDAYRGFASDGHNRSGQLISFVLRNIDTVEVTGPLTVQVTTATPWVSFPAFLYQSSRLGIMSQSQLLDEETCATKPVGTGPFTFTSWTPNVEFVAERNPDYWQIAPDGEPYPYVDRLVFEPITDGQVRNQAIEANDINAMHTSNAEDMAGKLTTLRDDGTVNMLASEDFAEVSFVQLNNSVPPFDDVRMRQALAMGANTPEINDLLNAGLPTVASGPYDPSSIGYVEDAGFPEYDLEAAKALIAEYVDEGGTPEFTLRATTDTSVIRLAELIQQRAEAVGVKVTIQPSDQATLIEAAIGKDYQAMTFRNYPGGDPDQLYVWFHSGNPEGGGEASVNLVNFAGVNDPELDALLDAGRTEPDPDARAGIYQDIQRRMATEVYGLWGWYTPWAVVTASNVHGILGPPLPGDDHTQPGDPDDAERQPSRGLATGHSLLGMWIAE